MTEPDEPELNCAHLIACHTIWYNAADLDAGYSLGRVIAQLRPPAADEFAFTLPRLFLYAQLWGTPDEYTLRIRLACPADTDPADAPEYGPWDVALTGDAYVEAFGFLLTQVPFEEPGVYEFQLWAGGFDEPVGRERIEVRERDDGN